jgi:Na+-transporting methylmalonyl-CoA/oxaloacetate decarboxylase gamma subunit
MPEINAATGALTIPIWAVGAVAAVFLVLMMLAVAQSGMAAVMNTLFRAAMVIAAVSAGWIYVQYLERQEQVAARRVLDDRAAALLARAVAPGSALSCLNELAGEAVEAACAKAVFASPEAVSAAVNYVTAELALLADGSDHARADPTYATEMAPVRTALELDRFGIVAHVLGSRGCKPEMKCDALELFNDPVRVSDNLRDHTFDDLVAKFTSAWNAPHGSAATADAAPPPLPVLHPVSPQYDFPSADSIPAVNIMVPEPGTGNASRQATTPIPPKRPQRTPVAAAAHPPPPRPPAAAPAAVGETPTDGAGTSSPQPQ